jgi:heme b synthase
VTRFCLLHCKHCRGAAQQAAYAGELSTDECREVLDNVASFARPIIILTGGEPMSRPDIYEIASYAHGLGLRVVMAPCGVLLNDETVARIVGSGISAVSISIDGATAASHDAFRGAKGAFDACMRGIEAVKRAGLRFQINTTVSRHNVAELPAILDLAVRLGAATFNPFLLVPTGRGRDLADQEISPQQYEETLQWLASQQSRGDVEIRVTCAPHYQRVLRQSGAEPAQGRGAAGGCMGGKSFAFISHRGKVQICGFLDVECGDLRQVDYDFKRVWDTSEVFRSVRDTDAYRGRCGRCEYRSLCGGCRARAYAVTGDYLAEEPFCVYEPKRPAAAVDEVDEVDKRVLSVIQSELPICARPYDSVAARLGVPAEEVLARVSRMRAEGLIRRIGPIFDSGRLGYSSTLVAARVPQERLDEIAALVSDLPGVTHNYRREHALDLWFTLTVNAPEKVESTLEDLRRRSGVREFYSLPAQAVYKARVNFHLSDDLPEASASGVRAGGEPVRLGEEQRELVRLLQEDLLVEAEPFAASAAALGWPSQRVIAQVADWLQQGVIRRFGAVVRHRRLGFVANGMAVFRVAPERVDAVGESLAQHREISHCYRRPPAPGWDYNLFAMVHGRSTDEVRRFVARIAAEHELPDHDILFSTMEYKKTSMKYFQEADVPGRVSK